MRKLFVAVLMTLSTLGLGFSAIQSASNGIYTMYLDDANGTYTLATGPSHPYPGRNVFYGGAAGLPGTSYLTVRSYTNNRDYVSRSGTPSTTPGFTVVNLGAPTVTPITGGFRATWNLTTPDTLRIEQETYITGNALSNSVFIVRTTVTNTGTSLLRIGIRYQWDWMIDASDDASIRRRNPNDPFFSTTFFDVSPVNFEFYEMTNATTLFNVYGTANGPAQLNVTPPTRFYFASWAVAYDNAWTFNVTGGGIDSAVVYFWGDSPSNAINLNPGQSFTVVQVATTFEVSFTNVTQMPVPDVKIVLQSNEFLDTIGVNFGNVQIFTRRGPAILRIENTGSGVVFISGIELREFAGGTGNFLLDLNSGDRPCGTTMFNLGPRNFCTVGVVFFPQSEGRKEAHLNVYSNLPYPVARIYMTGVGVPQASQTPQPTQPPATSPQPPPSSGGPGSNLTTGTGGGSGGCNLTSGSSPLSLIAWLLIPTIALIRKRFWNSL